MRLLNTKRGYEEASVIFIPIIIYLDCWKIQFVRAITFSLQTDLDHNIFKKRFDEHGNPVETEAKKEGNWVLLSSQEMVHGLWSCY